jgi:hypothetical protein
VKVTDEKLGKIVQLARRGHGGERTAALAIVRRLSQEQGLNFDDVMRADEAVHEYAFKYRDARERSLIVQMLLVYARPEGDLISQNTYRKMVFVETTSIRYIETAHAVEVYLAAYRKEKARIQRMLKDLPRAFIIKHNIFRLAGSDSDATYTPAELEEWRRQMRLADDLDDVTLRKTIGGGD